MHYFSLFTLHTEYNSFSNYVLMEQHLHNPVLNVFVSLLRRGAVNMSNDKNYPTIQTSFEYGALPNFNEGNYTNHYKHSTDIDWSSQLAAAFLACTPPLCQFGALTWPVLLEHSVWSCVYGVYVCGLHVCCNVVL